MIDSILKFVLEHRFLMLLAAAILVAGGVAAWNQLPVDAFPDVTNVQVMVLTKAPGWTPGEVERLVTFPIEMEMGGLPDVKLVRSLSQTGLSQVVVIFEDDVDTYFARQLVFERLAGARESLPAGLEPEMGPISTGLGEIYQYAVEAGYYCPEHPAVWSREAGPCPEGGEALAKADYDLMDLRTFQDWLIAPQLKRLAGINEVNSFGGYVKQFHIVPDPEMLLKYGVTLEDVTQAVRANNANVGAGYILRDWEQINVVSKGLLRDVEDIERVVVKAREGTPVYVKDLAEVRVGHQVRTGAAGRDGEGEAVLGMAIMLKDANSKIVVDRVKAEIPQIQKSLPAGVRITPYYDRTDLIQACIATVSNALVQGSIFIVIILFLLLWDLRGALIVALSLPMTAAATFVFMDWSDVTANLMSLGGLVIAIGLVVDAAIIVVENIARHMSEQAESTKTRSQIALEAVREVVRPVIFAILIVVVVFVPLFTLESMEGKMFKPLALTICFALLGSLLVSFTVVPVLAAMFTRRKAGSQEHNALVRAVHAVHIPLLKAAIRGRWITVALFAGLLVGAFLLLGQVGTEFLPALDEGAIAINLVRLPTASLEGSTAQAQAIERELMRAFPDEILTVVSKTGRAEISEDPMGPEQTDLIITLYPQRQWTAAESKEELVAEIERTLHGFPGIRPAFSQPIALRVNELISGIKSDIAIKIFGEDMAKLQEIAGEIAPRVAGVAGAKDVAIEQVAGFSQIEVELDRAAMARHQVSAEAVNATLEAAVGGSKATVAYEGQWPLAVVVRFPDRYREDVEALRELLVATPGGYHVPLGELARIEEVETPAAINREDSRRRLIVECNVRGRDLGGFVQEAQAALAGVEAGLPQGYRLVWGGQFENQQRAMRRLSIVVPIALLLIFVMLLSALNSFKSAALVMVNLPFAVVGGILAIHMLGIHLSVAASIGFIAVLGVAVEDGLVLISFCDTLRRRGMPVYDAVLEACRLRVRPLIMTTMTTLLGLLPMLYATGSGSELQKPLVAVIFGGMITSLLLELIALPVLYVIVHGKRTGQEAQARQLFGRPTGLPA